MIHFPVLRWGEPYRSLEVDKVVHFDTGEPVAEEQVEALRRRYDLDRPFMVQYLKWLNNMLPFGFERQDTSSYLQTIDGGFNWPTFKWPDLGMSFEWNR